MANYHTTDARAVSDARRTAAARAAEIGRPDLADVAALISSELVTNAMLHGGGCTGVDVTPLDDGLRVSVGDQSRTPPVLGIASEEALTGRGIRLVASLSSRWGAEARPEGKVVWADITAAEPDWSAAGEEDLLALWSDEWDEPEVNEQRFRVELGDVPTDLLLGAKSHVDSVVREFALATAGAESGLTSDLPVHLVSLLQSVVERFSDARLSIKHQALDAARQGAQTTQLVLTLPPTAADAAEDYVAALDEIDAYCRARRLLTVESPASHRVFRHWYIEELVAQLRAMAAGDPRPQAQRFDLRLRDEVERLAVSQRSSERAARLYAVTAALATAATPEDVAAVVLNEGVAALGAAGGGLFLAKAADELTIPGTVGYDDALVERLRSESLDAELPAVYALRTGEAVWIESSAERDRRFPELRGLEAGTVGMCAVPLTVQDRRLGALRFSFTSAGLFDEDERRFVLALAAQTAQALDRAQLQQARLDFSRRLQRSLLPPSLPNISGLDVAALYQPLAAGVEVGGDFYDLWEIGPDRWALAVGDATGHGPEAAALTALARHTLRAVTMTEQQPVEVMTRLNDALFAAALANEADGTVDERFCTVLFGVLEKGDRWRLRLAGGGHPPVIVARRDRVEVIVVGGSLLGVMLDPDIATAEVELDPGDTLVLLTDGMLEARRDQEMFDTSKVAGVLAQHPASAADTAAALERAVLEHTDGVLEDDLALMILRVMDESRTGTTG